MEKIIYCEIFFFGKKERRLSPFNIVSYPE